MLIFKKHTLKLGVMTAALLGIGFVACNDDDNNVPQFRSKEYSLKGVRGADSNIVVGTVKLSENYDSTVNLVVTLNKSVNNTQQVIRLIKGSITAPATDTIKVDSVAGTGNAVTKTLLQNVREIKVGNDTISFRYDSAVNYTAFIKVSVKQDSVTAVGNVFKAAQ
ncbi:hypothetical protein F0L74_02075 [Chitinophaga agrisoli]|uniref:Uncharacterized protein n=1 Tax=Chitinophaga agrisoli TaxID=2607653 RepID=A0A5B2W0B9_9BACT|nr:hypothetical protein [Chitinophaga agrisoli]KAA2244785.1 hypothetical protein F0L74_02075 [Chitinophaga agrisoli]